MALEISLSDVRWQICLVYLGGVIVFSPTISAILEHLKSVLQLLMDAWVSNKFSKCTLFQEKIEYLGNTRMAGKLAAEVVTTSKIFKTSSINIRQSFDCY